MKTVPWALCLCLLCCACRSDEPGEAAGDHVLPLANEHGLVTVQWLKSRIDAQPAHSHDLSFANNDGQSQPNHSESETSPAKNGFVIVEASWADLANATDYHRGHIPGAIHVNTDLFENGYPEWKLQPVESLQKTIGDLGIAPDTMVVVYSEQLIAATRVWWVLMYAGVDDVRILDGDARTWSEAGFELEQTTRELPSVSFVANPRTDWIIETPALLKHVTTHYEIPGNDRVVPLRLFDMRSRAEYDGEISGYKYLDAKGRIPSAISLGDADDSSQTYKLASGRLRPPHEIYAEWQSKGFELSGQGSANSGTLDVFYCGGGWRSSAAFFYAWLSGAKNIRNYSEGWAGWSTRYIRDESAQGNTPGWLQRNTGNPVENAGHRIEP
ncbi:MAG: hypothetical protein JNK57_07030 [Planctomycetaceae bacterium]|nr:hypothetical protein [Planctomycetaceae bacterium]